MPPGVAGGAVAEADDERTSSTRARAPARRAASVPAAAAAHATNGAPWPRCVRAGRPHPYGCTYTDADTLNFSVFATEPRHVTLALYHPLHGEAESSDGVCNGSGGDDADDENSKDDHRDQQGAKEAGVKADRTNIDAASGADEQRHCAERDARGAGRAAVFGAACDDERFLVPISAQRPARGSCVELRLDPRVNRTGCVWHISVAPALPSYRYEWRIGRRRSAHRVLDPYARLLDTPTAAHFNAGPASTSAAGAHDRCYCPRAVIPSYSAAREFDWRGVSRPRIPFNELIVYEMHVRSFTALATDVVAPPGTFAALIERIPYLTWLGVNCVELLPVFEFNEREWDRTNPHTGEQLCQYWGYSTVAFFAPMNRFSAVGHRGGCIDAPHRRQQCRRDDAPWRGSASADTPHSYAPFDDARDEFRAMVRELHRNGIELILDVVFNHTAETWQLLHFRALANCEYYLKGGDSGHDDVNFSGCGHTLACNNAVAAEYIHECIRYWALDLQVDGFRFDLASSMTRASSAPFDPLPHPPLMQRLCNDPALRDVKLIAEPWDIGLYQVGQFAQYGDWAEWNGKFRDDVRRFLGGAPGAMSDFATRVCGSDDLYARYFDSARAHGGRAASVNFVTAHDGFSLRDLVSYDAKHNEANGEQNADGETHNHSWNCGFEGDDNGDGGGDDGDNNDKNCDWSASHVHALRRRQQRNFFVALLLSAGVPMMRSGDEYGHTQYGNNNAWCQDNALNYFQWHAVMRSGARTCGSARRSSRSRQWLDGARDSSSSSSSVAAAAPTTRFGDDGGDGAASDVDTDDGGGGGDDYKNGGDSRAQGHGNCDDGRAEVNAGDAGGGHRNDAYRDAPVLVNFVRRLIAVRKRLLPRFRNFLHADRGEITWCGAEAGTTPRWDHRDDDSGDGDDIDTEAVDDGFIAYVLHGRSGARDETAPSERQQSCDSVADDDDVDGNKADSDDDLGSSAADGSENRGAPAPAARAGDVYVAFNARDSERDATLPTVAALADDAMVQWRVLADTAADAGASATHSMRTEDGDEVDEHDAERGSARDSHAAALLPPTLHYRGGATVRIAAHAAIVLEAVTEPRDDT